MAARRAGRPRSVVAGTLPGNSVKMHPCLCEAELSTVHRSGDLFRIAAMTAVEILWLAAVPAIYFALLMLGRWLKRRWGVKVGWAYQLFCVSSALFVPLSALDAPEALVLGLETALVLFGTLVVLALIQRGVWELHLGQKHPTPTPKFVGEVFNLVIFLVVVLVVLKTFYLVEIPHLIAGSGILAVILGLALQETLGNILAGLALHFEKPYRAGDWLIVDSRHAQVTEMNWRATRMRTNDDIYLDIPNSQLAKATIVNLSYPTPVHAMRLRVGLEYATPPNDAKDVLQRAAAQAAGVLKEPGPKVYVVDFADSGVTYEIKYWLSDHAHFNEINDNVRTNMWYELNRHGMRIPFPTRVLHMTTPRDTDAESRAAARKILRAQPLFKSFTDAQLDEMLAAARHGRYGRGEKIIEQGGAATSMFVLLEGGADVLVMADGHTLNVAVLGAGDCFGEMSLLTGEPRSATVVAKTDCEVVEIGKAGLSEMLQHTPELLPTLSEMLAQRRLRTEDARAESAQSRSAETQQAYAKTLLNRLKSFFEL